MTSDAAWTTTTPADHDTVWGFLARWEPWVLELMMDPIKGLFEDQERAKQIAHLLGYEPVAVPAPDKVRQAGVPEVFSFPMAVLLETFPANP